MATLKHLSRQDIIEMWGAARGLDRVDQPSPELVDKSNWCFISRDAVSYLLILHVNVSHHVSSITKHYSLLAKVLMARSWA